MTQPVKCMAVERKQPPPPVPWSIFPGGPEQRNERLSRPAWPSARSVFGRSVCCFSLVRLAPNSSTRPKPSRSSGNPSSWLGLSYSTFKAAARRHPTPPPRLITPLCVLPYTPIRKRFCIPPLFVINFLSLSGSSESWYLSCPVFGGREPQRRTISVIACCGLPHPRLLSAYPPVAVIKVTPRVRRLRPLQLFATPLLLS